MSTHPLPSPSELLNRLSVLDSEQRKSAQEMIERVIDDPTRRVAVTDILLYAIAKQDEWIAKIIEADPSFPMKLKAFLHDRLRGMQEQTAQADRAGLSQIETQFAS